MVHTWSAGPCSLLPPPPPAPPLPWPAPPPSAPPLHWTEPSWFCRFIWPTEWKRLSGSSEGVVFGAGDCRSGNIFPSRRSGLMMHVTLGCSGALAMCRISKDPNSRGFQPALVYSSSTEWKHCIHQDNSSIFQSRSSNSRASAGFYVSPDTCASLRPF